MQVRILLGALGNGLFGIFAVSQVNLSPSLPV